MKDRERGGAGSDAIAAGILILYLVAVAGFVAYNYGRASKARDVQASDERLRRGELERRVWKLENPEKARELEAREL